MNSVLVIVFVNCFHKRVSSSLIIQRVVHPRVCLTAMYRGGCSRLKSMLRTFYNDGLVQLEENTFTASLSRVFFQVFFSYQVIFLFSFGCVLLQKWMAWFVFLWCFCVSYGHHPT